jgi:hypothetical protein
MNTELLYHLSTMSDLALADLASDQFKRVFGWRPHHWDGAQWASRKFLAEKICELAGQEPEL